MAFPTWEGANAAADPARSEIMASFMVDVRLFLNARVVVAVEFMCQCLISTAFQDRGHDVMSTLYFLIDVTKDTLQHQSGDDLYRWINTQQF